MTKPDCYEPDCEKCEYKETCKNRKVEGNTNIWYYNYLSYPYYPWCHGTWYWGGLWLRLH